MAKVRLVDYKSEKNRGYVAKYRAKKKLKAVYEEKVQKRLKSLLEREPENCIDSHHDVGTNVTMMSEQSCFATEFQHKLILWASNNRLSGDAINGLLIILIWAGFSFLPKDSRTLRKTPTVVPIEKLSNGKLFYHGIGKCIENTLAKAHEHISAMASITLNFNFDGCPISKSSASQFWPILASIKGNCNLYKKIHELPLKRIHMYILFIHNLHRISTITSDGGRYLAWRNKTASE